MTERKIKVPEWMLKASLEALGKSRGYREALPASAYGTYRINLEIALEAALRALSENPIVPSREQCIALTDGSPVVTEFIACAWQRRMFLAPEPEIPEALKDLVGQTAHPEVKEIAVEAYRRGKEESGK